MGLIGKRIFALMKEKNITQKELSIKAGIGQSTISDWQTKGTDPRACNLIAIAEALEVDVINLLK
jgi:transcriptional regulator with XRE-family HTH domain